jgi:hypothetical protein
VQEKQFSHTLQRPGAVASGLSGETGACASHEAGASLGATHVQLRAIDRCGDGDESHNNKQTEKMADGLVEFGLVWRCGMMYV